MQASDRAGSGVSHGVSRQVEQCGHGVEQTNALLYEVGFHQSYLVILIVVDGREISGGTWADGGLTPALTARIGGLDALKHLAPECGLLLVQVCQPVDRPIEEAGGISLRLVRSAKAVRQSPELTSRIDRWLDDTKVQREQASPISTLELFRRHGLE
jgi:hypothetical protein